MDQFLEMVQELLPVWFIFRRELRALLRSKMLDFRSETADIIRGEEIASMRSAVNDFRP